MLAGHWRHGEVDTLSFYHLVEIHEAMSAMREAEAQDALNRASELR